MTDSYDYTDYSFSNQTASNDISDSNNSKTNDCLTYTYNPINYDTVDYKDWNQYTLQSTINNNCRNDLKPTVFYDHFFRAAIASDLKNKGPKNDDVNLSKYLFNNSKNQRRFKPALDIHEEEIKIKRKKPFDKLDELCDELDNVTLPILSDDDSDPEKSNDSKNSTFKCVVTNVNEKSNGHTKTIDSNNNNVEEKGSLNNKHERIVNNRFIVSVPIPEIITTDKKESSESIEMEERTPKETNKFLTVNDGERRQSMLDIKDPNAIKKKFSIVSLFNNPAAAVLSPHASFKQIFATPSIDSSREHLNNLSEIMNKCLTSQNLQPEEISKPKVLEETQKTSEKKVVHFKIQDNEDEKTVEEINRQLIEEGLPNLKKCMMAQREVKRQKKKREHTKDRVSGLIFSFLIFGAILCLGSLLMVQLIDETIYKLLEPNQTAIVFTGCNRYIGRKILDKFSFIGIPYVSETQPKMRWKSYKRSSCQSKTGEAVDATQYGAVCTQLYKDRVIGSEKCQFINIFTPSINTEHRYPVIFYIHGGNLIKGSGNLNENIKIDPKISENAVIVTFNYRLNIFGFFVNENETNFGYRDQIAALRWVNEHISYFDGDRNKIMLMSDETNSISPIVLSLAKQSINLFNSIWITNLPENVAHLQRVDFNDMKQKYLSYFHNRFNCNMIDTNCLFSVNSSELCKAYEQFRIKENFDLQSSLIIDDELFSKQQIEHFFDPTSVVSDHLLSRNSNSQKGGKTITLVIGTNFNDSATNVICNSFKFLKQIHLFITTSVLHYNIEDDNSNKLTNKTNDIFDTVEINSIFDYESNYNNREIKNNLIKYLIQTAKNDPMVKFEWGYFPTKSLLINQNSANSINYFVKYCNT